MTARPSPPHRTGGPRPSFAGPTGPGPFLDAGGRYRAWGRISYSIVGAHLFLLVIILVLLGRTTMLAGWVSWAIGILLVGSLVRYLSTHYRIDDMHLVAARFLGGVRIRLDQVRRIEYVSLRDLAPTTGLFGSWGWRGRMWSPQIGWFESAYTDSVRGLLITAGDFPLYLSPRDPEAFARELSRRVRSYSGRLSVDVGDPLGSSSPHTP